jgi:hypothetical protein
MKTVVNIIGLMSDGSFDLILIQKVPDDWRECSVSGEWRPLEEFGLNDNGNATRTNCTRTYMMNTDDYKATKEAFEKLKSSGDYKAKEALIKKNANLMCNTMRIGDLIASLGKLNPEDFVCITQSGYYAEGDRAEIFTAEVVGKQEYPFGERVVYSIGHSSQSY